MPLYRSYTLVSAIQIFAVLGAIVILGACGREAMSVEALEQRFAEYMAAGNYDKAQTDINNALKLEPNNTRLRQKQGDVYFAQDQFSAAEVAYRKASEDNEVEPGLLLKIGESLLAQGKFQRVLSEVGDVCGELNDDPRTICKLQRATAQLKIPNTNRKTILQSFVEVFRELDGRELPAAKSALARLSTEPVVIQARAHYECRVREPSAEQISFSETYGVLPTASGNVIRVGPGRDVESIAEAATRARDGDTIEIDGAVYGGDVAVWRANDITIRGVNGRPQLKAQGKSAKEKGIWSIVGDRYLVENIEFSGAVSKDRNGAGIRMQGDDLIIRDSFFHNNQNGLLTGQHPQSHIVVENTLFSNNGYGDGYTHNIYVGRSKRFVLAGSVSTGAIVGHLVKSRAQENYVLYNRLMDENDGNSSMVIDLSEAGKGVIIGNLLQQSSVSENVTMISFGAEGGVGEYLAVIHNTTYNQNYNGIFVDNHTNTEALIANNILAGAPLQISSGPRRLVSNLVGVKHGLKSPRDFDFSLEGQSEAIDGAEELSEAGFPDLAPKLEYAGDLRVQTRLSVAAPDIGALEFCGY